MNMNIHGLRVRDYGKRSFPIHKHLPTCWHIIMMMTRQVEISCTPKRPRHYPVGDHESLRGTRGTSRYFSRKLPACLSGAYTTKCISSSSSPHRVYLMVFHQCMSVLKHRHSSPNNYLVGTAISMFILITGHLIVDILRNMQAFTSAAGIANSNYPLIYYNTFDTWQNMLKSTLYVAVTLVSDAFILYRSYIVWGRDYRIAVLPLFLFIADFVFGVLWIYTLSLVNPGDDVFAGALSIRVKIFYSITLVMNIICTSLIAFRILKIQKAVSPFAGSNDPISRLVPIIIESGSVYSALLVIMIGTYTSGSPAMFIFLNSMSPIIGIVFSSVIVRVGLGLSHGDSHRGNATISSTRLEDRWVIRPCPRPYSEQIYSPTFPPNRSAQVMLQQTIHTHIDRLHDAESGSTQHGEYKSSSLDATP